MSKARGAERSVYTMDVDAKNIIKYRYKRNDKSNIEYNGTEMVY